MTGKVFVLGSFVVDLMCRTPHLPTPGETVFAGPFKMGPGGKGSNQAVAAARAGAHVNFLTQLGDDLFAKLALDTFKAENIPLTHIHQSAEHETGAALIMVEEGAENMITVSVGACNHLTQTMLDKAQVDISAADVFLTQMETNLDVMFAGLKLAKENGLTTILNPAPVQEIDLASLENVDIITPNETEASKLTGITVTCPQTAEKAAAKLIDAGVKTVIITLGRQGALVCDGKQATLVPAFDVGKAVDTTGAGDGFNGGFAAALAEGKDITTATKYGCAVAGLSVTRLGTAPAMPKQSEIQALLAGKWQQNVA